MITTAVKLVKKSKDQGNTLEFYCIIKSWYLFGFILLYRDERPKYTLGPKKTARGEGDVC